MMPPSRSVEGSTLFTGTGLPAEARTFILMLSLPVGITGHLRQYL